MPKLLEQANDLGKQAISLPKETKDEISKLEKTKALKAGAAMTHNIKMLKRVVGLAANTSQLIKRATEELNVAYEELNEDKEKLSERGTILADEAITKPVDCYKKFHDWEESDIAVEVVLEYLNIYDKELGEVQDDEPEDMKQEDPDEDKDDQPKDAEQNDHPEVKEENSPPKDEEDDDPKDGEEDQVLDNHDKE